jgi:L-amino acid N-acyltransferase YncA
MAPAQVRPPDASYTLAGMTIALSPLQAADWPVVHAIYGEGIATGDATFETSVPDWDTWDAGHLPHSRLVAALGSDVVGWAALAPVSARAVYAGVAEVSVYVAERGRGQGVGGALLGALVSSSEEYGVWTLQAGIFPENRASVALHERHGFRVVGVRERIGQLRGRWRNVLLLERRSGQPRFA